MNLLSSKFLWGPNIYAPSSGFTAQVDWTEEDPVVGWAPDVAQAQAALRSLGQALPVGVGRGFSRSAEEISASPAPALELIVATFDHIAFDVCVRPGSGRLVEAADRSATVFLFCDEARIGDLILPFAISAADAIVTGATGGLTDRFRVLHGQLRAEALNPWTLALARAAEAGGVPCERLFARGQFLWLGQGARGKRVMDTVSDATSFVAGVFAADKFLVLSLLEGHFLPTPGSRLITSGDQALELAANLGYPLVVKPRSGAEGRGAIVNIQNAESLNNALRQAAAYQSPPMLERFIAGEEFSLLVAGGQILAATRTPPGYQGEGTCTDVTGALHPDNRVMAERAARLIGLDMAEVVFRSPDIARSWRESDCAILHVKSMPALRPHMAANPARDFAGAVVGGLFPDGEDGRIPTVGVTGSIGKSTTCHMAAAILSKAGLTVARSTTQGAWIGSDKLAIGDLAGGAAARRLLSDPGVEAGVFELARGGLIKMGMGLDTVDVGVMLNVQDNHMGLDGVKTREDLAAVKGLVVRYARKLVILNADDPLCLAMRDHVAAPALCLVSASPDNPAVAAHRQAGGATGILHRQDGSGLQSEIRLFHGQTLIGAVSASEIPACHGGRFEPPLIAALYAAAIADGLGVDFGTIRAGLAGFDSDFDTNPWRMNFIEGLPLQTVPNMG